MSLSYRNQSINLKSKSIDWFDIRKELVVKGLKTYLSYSNTSWTKSFITN